MHPWQQHREALKSNSEGRLYSHDTTTCMLFDLQS